MNKSLFGKIKMVSLMALLLSGGSAAAAESGCWVDLYEKPDFSGAHVRLKGPLKLRNMRSVEGANWQSRIDSLKAGPKAKVVIYENTDFKLTLTEMSKYPDLMKSLGVTKDEVKEESELIFSPGETSHHLGELNFHKRTKSIKIECVK